MKLNFEEFLNSKGLKVGDKIKLSNGYICEIGYSASGMITLTDLEKEKSDLALTLLEIRDFEKIEPNFEKVKPKKKVGDRVCRDTRECPQCPLYCVRCSGGISNTLREKLEITLEKYPELEPMRKYLEQKLNKEVEEDD